MFNLHDFVGNPSVEALTALRKSDWVELAAHFDLGHLTSLPKSQLRELVLQHLVDQEILDQNVVQQHFPNQEASVELARINLEREKLKLEILREQNRGKETPVVSAERLIPHFDESHPEVFFAQFEKVARLHQWPRDRWAVMISHVFTGEAKRVYVGLTLDESLDYDLIKATILQVYKRVPAYYRNLFRTSQKRPDQTCANFFREKEQQCRKWIESAEATDSYQKLFDLIVYEELLSCMPTELKSHLEGLGIQNKVAAGPAADHLLLTYPNVSFRTKASVIQPVLKPSSNHCKPGTSATLPHRRKSSALSASGRYVEVYGMFEYKTLPLCLVYLQSALVSGYVVVGVVEQMPAGGISMIMGNDLAGSRMFSPFTEPAPPSIETSDKPRKLKLPVEPTSSDKSPQESPSVLTDEEESQQTLSYSIPSKLFKTKEDVTSPSSCKKMKYEYPLSEFFETNQDGDHSDPISSSEPSVTVSMSKLKIKK
ncbi:hypothetical protein Pcinc_035914 [Petrolisthes cinctipes]|uniref:Uncharacterized protein n=1 Tax=Petrolisthes cinctipes TaxID=88211 RepID=A0AAE1BXB7_PETCI|nr:hypothetical protein Pcinc_035914 [Petrolisthes cinctipes]